MKKTCLALFALCFSLFVKADEGMWTLYNLPQAVFQQMQSYGFKRPYADIYQSKNAIKNAVVSFSGYCSGVVVSPDGLVFTNHHCGFEAIRKHSTVEKDYMKNGFVANSFAEELPNENLFVSFMVSQEDVTPRLAKLGFNEMSVKEQESCLAKLEKELNDSIKHKGKFYQVQIDPYYEGNQYYATTYRLFPDVRLVFTIPKSMGKFGGEIDNWMWPRQTSDFAVFRVYASPNNNEPAEYSKENVPYKPATWAPVSMKGYKEGSFAMTIGYPGSTSRYLSSYGIKERKDAINEPTAQVRGVKQEVMTKHMRASDAVRIKYESIFASSANYWKNSIGMNKCIDSIGLIQQKERFEARLRAWQDSTKFLKGKLQFDSLASLYAQRFSLMRTLRYFRETFRGTSELVNRYNEWFNYYSGWRNALHSAKKQTKPNAFVVKNNADEWDENLDKEVLTVLLKNYKEQVKNPTYLPKFYDVIAQKFNNNYADYVDFLYKNSELMKTGAKLNNIKSLEKKDAGVFFGSEIHRINELLRNEILKLNPAIETQEKYLCAAKLRMEEDKPHYSDANSTMRLSYGQVTGYKLGGKYSGYYTIAPSIVEKMNRAHEVYDYNVQPELKELLSATSFGEYTDKDSKNLQLCFLTTNDITGGNSGSPIFNGEGELIGLAFDGNWDSLSSDINYDAQLARCIGVDVRYMLYLMDKWGKADRLIKEINAKK